MDKAAARWEAKSDKKNADERGCPTLQSPLPRRSFHCQRGLAKTLFAAKKISLRRRTTVSQRLPRELARRISNHLRTVRNLRKARNYSADQIAVVDETGLWVDMPGNSTLEEVGSRTVAIKTTGHEKARFTVVLGARADGSRMHPLVIFKGKRKEKALDRITGVVVQMQENAWTNEEIALRWLTSLWGGIASTRYWRCSSGTISVPIKLTV